ncbi:FAD/NAD(P)-binding protein [Pseudomonas sp. TWP3-1]|uniref:FAD/NAD(P)-binding protein n=1 Tax=Pseudomonas sp. TWP3-1 TaxID=2804631 RepID=UPI003CE6DDDB
MNTLVIIGAGFSGTVAAIEFLHAAPEGARLIIINRSGAMARGLAYGTSSSKHLLNVPAGNMSALVDDPDSFLRACQRSSPSTTSGSFVPRKQYGEYLASLLEAAEKHALGRIGVERITAEVTALTAQERASRVELSCGKTIFADHVILAFGHFPPRTPPALESILDSPRYIANPWSASITAAQSKDASVLLLGSGLTALDVISTLEKASDGIQIHMLSRRGLLPQPHRVSKSTLHAPLSFQDDLLSGPATVLSYLRTIKRQIASGKASGLDWRDVIASVRPITSQLWMRLPIEERRRFLRHLQPYWDVHRHRVAPETYELFEQALNLKQIIPIAGRIHSVETCGEKTLIIYRRRGNEKLEKLEFDRVINCTGPNSNPHLISEPLIRQLITDGLISIDELGLGVQVDDSLAVLGKTGMPSEWLSYVGPMLKANFWEATAVPELRLYASALARRIARKFSAI